MFSQLVHRQYQAHFLPTEWQAQYRFLHPDLLHMHPTLATALLSLLRLPCTFQQPKHPHSSPQAVPAVQQSQQFFMHRDFLHRHATATLTSSSCFTSWTLESYQIVWAGKRDGEKNCQRAREKRRVERWVLERSVSQPDGETWQVLLQPGWAEIYQRDNCIIIFGCQLVEWNYLVARSMGSFGLRQPWSMEQFNSLSLGHASVPFSYLPLLPHFPPIILQLSLRQDNSNIPIKSTINTRTNYG